MQKKLLAILLTLCMVLGMFPLAIMAEDTTGDTTVVEETTTEPGTEPEGEETSTAVPIGTAEELLALMNAEDPATAWAKDYYLTADITLPDEGQASIGNNSTGTFSGSFDGRGHEISNLKLSGASYHALFGKTSGNVTIQNLTVSGSVAPTINNGHSAGIIGYLTGSATIKNVTSNVTVTAPSTSSYHGGIVASFVPAAAGATLTLTNCVNNGDITGKSYLGGMIGYLGSSLSGHTVTLTGCVNNGNVSGGTAGSGAAGMIGYNLNKPTDADNHCTINITKCANYGDIHAKSLVGGIFGATKDTNYTASTKYYIDYTITEVYNSGALSVEDGGYIGGIIGIMRMPYVKADNVAPYTLSDWMHAGPSSDLALIGTVGGVVFNAALTNAYNSVGAGIVGTANGPIATTDDGTVNGTIANILSSTTTAETIVLSGCCDTSENTTAEMLTALAAKTGWTTGNDGKPMLAEFYVACDHSKVTDADVEITPATCTETGLKVTTCPVCKNVETEIIPIDPAAHPEDATTTDHAESTKIVTRYDCCDAVKATVEVDTVINDAAELLALMNQENALYLALDYTLGGNIVMTDVAGQSPIGSNSLPFTGSFDGKGYKIEGISIEVTELQTGTEANAGFFSVTKGATIKNLTLTGTVTTSTKNLDYTGGLIGKALAPLTIDNVTVDVDTNSGGYGNGGFVGNLTFATKNATASITNSVNKGDIQATLDAAGNAKYASGFIGIIGASTAAGAVLNISKCENHGDITAAGDSNGGFIGYNNYSKTGGNFSITKCANYGDVKSTGTASSSYYVGGIIGKFSSASNKYETALTISECYNEGTITSGTGTFYGAIIGAYLYSIAGEDGYAPFTLTNVMNAGNDAPIIGATGNVEAKFKASYLYNKSGAGIVSSGTVVREEINGEVQGTGVGVVVLENCCNNLSSTEELAAFAASSDAWTLVGVAPMLTEFVVECTHKDAEGNDTTTATTIDSTCLVAGNTTTTCTQCGAVVSLVELPLNASAHESTEITYVGVTGGVEYHYACCNALAATFTPALGKVYVSDNGTTVVGNSTGEALDATVGATADKPFGTLAQAEAIAAAYANANGAATLVITDKATMSAKNTNWSEHEGTVTVTGGTLHFGVADLVLRLYGDTTFENMTWTASASGAKGNVFANNNKIVLGENMNTGTLTSGEDNNYLFYVVAGYYGKGDSKLEGDITVRSGSYNAIIGGNRFEGAANPVSGAPKVTVGAPAGQTLHINMFEAFSMSGGNLSAPSTATVFVDGAVTVDVFYPAITYFNDCVGDGEAYTINLVITGDMELGEYRNHTKKATATTNVFADARVATAATVSAAIATAAESMDNVTVNQYTYAQYCVEYLNGHTDGDVCANCGIAKCAHPTTEKEVVVAGTCNTYGTYNLRCTVCKELVNDEILTETEYADNHVANTNNVWAKDAETGMYYIDCSACENRAVESVEAIVYVDDANGSDDNDGLTVDTALATLNGAIARISTCGGTIAINGLYTISARTTMDAWEGTVKFTSATFSSGKATSGFELTTDGVAIHLGGASLFDGILFTSDSAKLFNCYMYANWNDVEFKYARATNKTTMMLVAGPSAKETDERELTTTLNIAGVDCSENDVVTSGSEADYFFTRIYMGGLFAANNVDLANKTVILNLTKGYDSNDGVADVTNNIHLVYLTSACANDNYKESVSSNCHSIINAREDSAIYSIYTGAQNMNQADVSGVLDNATLNFYDNSQVSGATYMRNLINTTINISDETEDEVMGKRTVPMYHSFRFYKYGTFTENTTAQVTVNYGSHGFISTIAEPVSVNPETNPYIINYVKVDECVMPENGTVTTEPTPEAPGVLSYICTCGRTLKTEEIPYECDVHTYVAKANGTYYCAVCDEVIDAPAGNVIASLNPATFVNGTATMTVAIKATDAIAGAWIVVTLPTGVALAAAEPILPEVDADATGFAVSMKDALESPFNIALINMTGAEATIDSALVKLTLTADEELAEGAYVIGLAVTEALDSEDNAVDVTAVSAEVILAAEPVAGDVNADGAISIVDALLILKAVLNNTPIAEIANADMNNDGVLTLIDVIKVLNAASAE